MHFVKRIDFCKFVQLTFIVDKRVMIQHIQRVLTEMHAAMANLCAIFFEHGVFRVLFATAHKAGAKTFVTFHDVTSPLIYHMALPVS